MPSFIVPADSRALLAAQGVLRLNAPLKLNLALHILGQRADSYHDLQSLVAFSTEGDNLEFRAAKRDSFYTDGAFSAHLGKSRNNLVLKARDALRQAFGRHIVPPAAIRLTKNLPVSAGLGGGSADAAACLIGLCILNGIEDNAAETGGAAESLKQTLMRLAADLGADVPMCLAWFYQKTAYIARDKGETLSALPHFPALPLVVVNNGARLSTAAVFKALQSRNNAPFPQNKAEQRLNLHEAVQFLQTLRNDLYAPALQSVPALADILALLRASGALYASMSGSGASCFGLYASKAAAARAAALIKAAHSYYFVAAAQTDGAPQP